LWTSVESGALRLSCAAAEDLVKDTWSRWEIPVLRTLADWQERVSDGDTLKFGELLHRLGASNRNKARVVRALDSLARAGMVDAVEHEEGQYPAEVPRATRRGLRRVGAWPHSEGLLLELVTFLQEMAESSEAVDSRRAAELRAVAAYLTEEGRGRAIEFFSAQLAPSDASAVRGEPD
jgi:hypothetical protein